MNDSEKTSPAHLPHAITEPARNSWLPWLLPIAALALTAWLVKDVASERGEALSIEFDSGFGLRAGDALRFRGIEVGEVERVTLARNGRGVVVHARLLEDARWLARAGTRFWIARPEIGLSGVSGLDTLVGPRYVQALPGAEEAPAQNVFRGLETPPVEPPFEGGLEILLDSTSRQGLSAGAPILYRDMPVGQLISLRLAGDAQRVEFRAVIAPEFSELVRAGTRFYRAPGFELSASLLDGIQFELSSIEGLLSGAVSFATPQDGGDAAATGQRFGLYEQPEKSWLEWSPTLAVGAALLPDGARVPEPRRGALRWKEGRFLRSRERKLGWSLRLEDALLGPADVLRAPDEALDGSTELEVAGQTLSPLAAKEQPGRLIVELPMTNEPGTWPRERMRTPVAPEAVLVFGDPGQGPRAIEASRLTPLTGAGEQPAWELTDGGGFSRDWHGAPVLGREDGALIGLLFVEGSRTRIALIP